MVDEAEDSMLGGQQSQKKKVLENTQQKSRGKRMGGRKPGMFFCATF